MKWSFSLRSIASLKERFHRSRPRMTVWQIGCAIAGYIIVLGSLWELTQLTQHVPGAAIAMEILRG